MSGTPSSYDCFAVTAPGLEAVAAMELRALGLDPGEAEAGGLSFRADHVELYAANLHLRTASRVIVRVATFHASSFRELERHARRLPWERFVAPGQPVRVRVTCRKSRLYHSDAVAERVLGAIGHRLGMPAPGSDAGADEAEGEGDGGGGGDDGSQLFVVRLDHDLCTVSADSSGRLLHMRGYRQAVGRAPLRETVAAAMLLASGWDPASPLVDPMCGSGTIAIEGAMLARRMAPGLDRGFAFERWPEHHPASWRELLHAARSDVLPAAPAPVVAADRDAGAVAATIANAERAGVASDLTVIRQPLSALRPPDGGMRQGWLVTNPPYGHRVGERDALRSLYSRLGQVAHTLLSGWTVAILSADARLEGQVGLEFEHAFRTSNGGIPVRLAVGRVPAQGGPGSPGLSGG